MIDIFKNINKQKQKNGHFEESERKFISIQILMKSTRTSKLKKRRKQKVLLIENDRKKRQQTGKSKGKR